MLHDDILKRYASLIIDIVEEQYISTESGVTSYKAKLKLKGNSSLRTREGSVTNLLMDPKKGT